MYFKVRIPSFPSASMGILIGYFIDDINSLTSDSSNVLSNLFAASFRIWHEDVYVHYQV